MKITVSGPPGAGTSTVSSFLADRFDLEHVSSGDVFRAMADERDVSLAEFGAIAEQDPSIDEEIDERQREIAAESTDIVMEGRLSGWMVEDPDLAIWIDAPLDVRAERVADREADEDVDEARERIAARAESEAKRYHQIHGIDIDDRSIYDLVIDTHTWGEDAVNDLVATAVERLE